MPDNNNQKTNYPVDKDTLQTAKAAAQEDNMDNKIIDEEAQNITNGAGRISGEEAKQATKKANESKQ